MTVRDSAPDPISALYAAVLQMEKAAADARTIAERLAEGAAEARHTYQAATTDRGADMAARALEEITWQFPNGLSGKAWVFAGSTELAEALEAAGAEVRFSIATRKPAGFNVPA